ncbi:MAG: GntR family transcriptional regulator [Sneathiellaceae bacterium]
MTIRPRQAAGGSGLASQSLKALLGVRDLIVSGTARPGERMSELALVDRLGLSRTPVRAALAQLAQEGLLEALPGGGYAVRAFSHGDIADAIELRGVLEGTAARLAAERGAPPAALDAVRRLLQELDVVVAAPPGERAFGDYVAGNERFHDLLARLAGSDLIRREVERVVTLPFAGPSAFVEAQAALPAFRDVMRQAQGQHWAMLEAIEGREGARAEALAREHARLARRNLDAVLRNAALADRVPGLALLAR